MYRFFVWCIVLSNVVLFGGMFAASNASFQTNCNFNKTIKRRRALSQWKSAPLYLPDDTKFVQGTIPGRGRSAIYILRKGHAIPLRNSVQLSEAVVNEKVDLLESALDDSRTFQCDRYMQIGGAVAACSLIIALSYLQWMT